MRRLSINGTFADLPSETIGLTWQYFDVTDPEKRFNPYSSTIRLPMTPRNVSLLGYANATGARLTTARSVPEVDYYFGPVRVITGGTMKVTSIEGDAFICNLISKTSLQEDLMQRSMDDVVAQCAKTWTASYATVMASLGAGTDGWILPRVIEDDVTSKTWDIHNYDDPADVPKHELWIAVSKLFDALETLHGFTFSVMESAGATDLQSSDLYGDILTSLYIPAFNYVLFYETYATSWYTKKLSSGTRTIGTESFEYSGVSFFAGKSAWEFIKLIGLLTGCIVYFDNGNIVLVPIDNLDIFDPIDLSGKVTRKTKYINLPGYQSSNYLRYQTSDNLAKDYGQSIISANVFPSGEKQLLTLDAVLPGRYYNITEAKSLWNTNYASNGDLKSSPCLLFDDGTTATGITVTWTGSPGTQSQSVTLRVLTHFRLMSNYISLYAAAQKGEMYEVEAGINLYDYLRLKPYKLIRINEVGGLCFLNSISNFDPYSGKPARMQVVRWVVIPKPLDMSDVCQAFVSDYYDLFLASGVIVSILPRPAVIIFFTAQTAGVDFVGDTIAETIADDIAGVVTNDTPNITAQSRVDRLTLTGTGGEANILCNGVTRAAIFNGTLAQTADDFVRIHGAAYLAAGVVLSYDTTVIYFTGAVAGVDFTGNTTITNTTPNLAGTVIMEWEEALSNQARIDYVTLSGTKGILNITCNGITRPAGFKIG